MTDRREEVRQLLRATARMLQERERTSRDWQVGKIWALPVDGSQPATPLGWAAFSITIKDVDPEVLDLLSGYTYGGSA